MTHSFPGDSRRLERLFRPASVAIYGSFSGERGLGRKAVSNLMANGYQGQVIPITKGSADVAGFRTHASAGDYAGPIDLALVIVPANAVPDVLRDLATGQVASAVVYSGGFGEISGAGEDLQKEVAAVIRESGITLLGPNCLGFGNFYSGVVASPFSVGSRGYRRDGPLAIVSQSGAVATDILHRSNQAGLSSGFWVSTGNEIDVTTAECLEYAATLPDVLGIGLYLENIGDVRALDRAMTKARSNGKFVVALRAGTSEAGAAAISSHTGSLVTDGRLYDELFRDLGVSRARSVRELVAALRVGVLVGSAPRRVAVVSTSGGGGAIAADAANANGVPLAAIGKEAQERLRSVVPFCSPTNPIDMTGTTGQKPEIIMPFLSTVMEEPDVGLTILIYTTGLLSDESGLIGGKLLEVVRRYPGHRLLLVGAVRPEAAAEFTRAGLEVFDDVVDLITTLSTVWFPRGLDAKRSAGGGLARRTEFAGRRMLLLEDDGLDFLESLGLPVVDRMRLSSEADLKEASRRLGYPVALKAIAAGVTHKTEAGLVRIMLRSPEALSAAYLDLAQQLRKDGNGERMLAQRMVEDVVFEVLLSAFIDPLLGPFVVAGVGGSLTELVDDVAMRRAPVDRDEALAMVRSLRAYPRIARSRSGMAGNLDELVEAIVRLAQSIGQPAHDQGGLRPGAKTPRVAQEIEINPFLVRSRGSCAVDAVVAFVEADDPAD